jgi:hypothetical protein
MGYIKHHAIIVTSWNDKVLKEAHSKAVEYFCSLVSPIIASNINKYGTFLIAPDGSKEGWDISNDMDLIRDEYVKWINGKAYDDGSNSLSYAMLYYGEDNGRCEVISHN